MMGDTYETPFTLDSPQIDRARKRFIEFLTELDDSLKNCADFAEYKYKCGRWQGVKDCLDIIDNINKTKERR